MAKDSKKGGRPASNATDEVLDRAGEDLTGWAEPARRLRQALENDELRLFCQPIVSLRADRPRAMAEVLVRLLEEEAAHLPPGDFLPVFAHYGMMPALDRWVVSCATRLLALEGTGGFRHLAINVASQTLLDREMPAFVARTLEKAAVAPDALCFEVDERDVLERPEAAAAFAAAVRAHGCEIAIDGFGHHAVSFAPLKAMKIDYLKVDGSITRKLLGSDIALRKMQAIVRVGEAIGFGVIAEFVEDVEIVERLRALGVDYAQGFGIARPGPIGEVSAGR